MIFNGVDIGKDKIEAVNNDEIEIYSKDLEKRIYFSYNRNFLDLDSIKVNETVDLIKYILGYLFFLQRLFLIILYRW